MVKMIFGSLCLAAFCAVCVLSTDPPARQWQEVYGSCRPCISCSHNTRTYDSKSECESTLLTSANQKVYWQKTGENSACQQCVEGECALDIGRFESLKACRESARSTGFGRKVPEIPSPGFWQKTGPGNSCEFCPDRLSCAQDISMYESREKCEQASGSTPYHAKIYWQKTGPNSACRSCPEGGCALDIGRFESEQECREAPGSTGFGPPEIPSRGFWQKTGPGNSCEFCPDRLSCAQDISTFESKEKCELAPAEIQLFAKVYWQKTGPNSACHSCPEGGCALDIGRFESEQECREAPRSTGFSKKIPEIPSPGFWQKTGPGNSCQFCPDRHSCAQDIGMFESKERCQQAPDEIPYHATIYWQRTGLNSACRSCIDSACALDIGRFLTEDACKRSPRSSTGFSTRFSTKSFQKSTFASPPKQVKYEKVEKVTVKYEKPEKVPEGSEKLLWQKTGENNDCESCVEGLCAKHIAIFESEASCQESESKISGNKPFTATLDVFWQKTGPAGSCVPCFDKNCARDVATFGSRGDCEAAEEGDARGSKILGSKIRWQKTGPLGACVPCKEPLCARDIFSFDSKLECQKVHASPESSAGYSV